ncbi:kinase-like protein [Meira miltonrushii]|uniref:Kinase-like protein n=1 Tax=Meira miltonrushii TaxID=1280837 RepID=A0A316VF56_9BASI|nr:kinase-like protein [Meira miltonrushii]PWN36267.1 kinase-like protein [Meira miltonrushii]
MDESEGQDFSHSALNRLKRDRLIELCEQEGVLHAKDATRAILIDALLAHHGNNRDDIASSHTEKPDSTSSTRTARPGSSDPNAKKTKGSRENVTESDKPLLLRTQSLRKESHSKPGTPIPSQNEEDLNGLDLESLQLVDKEIAFNKLEKLDKIGSGGFKDVYVGKYHITKKTTRKVAIADIRDQLSEMDIKELTLLRDLKHENIVRFIGVCIPPVEMRLTPCMIVSELCANGDLYDYIRNVEPPPDDEIFRILLQTARGLEYLHLSSPAIIHRDVKSTNVLITRNKTAKINDFGLARVRNNKRSMIKSLVGTVNWQAVELWCPKPNYNEKVDVWSAGMTFWEALQWHQPEKKYPFQDMNEHQIYQDVGQKKLRPSTVSIRRRYGSEIVELLDRMWDQNPKLRPTMTEVCEEMEKLVQMKKEAAVAAAAASADSDSKDKKYKANNTTRNASR